MAEIEPEEFALHSGRMGVATALAADGTEPMAIKKEGRWSSDAFMTYVRANMEDSRWGQRSLSRRSPQASRQPGQGTRWVRYTRPLNGELWEAGLP